VVIHKTLGLGEIGRARAVLDGKPVDTVAAGLLDDAPRAAGHLGDGVGAKVMDDLVKGTADRRQRRKPLDHLVAPANGLPALNRIAIFVVSGPRIDIAIGVRVFLEQLRREGMHQVPADIFPRRDVDMQVRPFLGRDFGKSPFLSASPVETICTTAEWPPARSCPIAPISVGVIIEVIKCEKKRCLVLSKAERAADFALRFSVPASLVMLVASSAAVRLL